MLLTFLLTLISLFFFALGIVGAATEKHSDAHRYIVWLGSWAIAIAIAIAVRYI